MNNLTHSITAADCTFYLSWRQHPLGMLPAPLGISLDGSRWAAALDLQIEEPIMRKILNHPEPNRFWLAHRIYINVDILLAVHPRGPLADRARALITNCTGQFHPITFNN